MDTKTLNHFVDPVRSFKPNSKQLPESLKLFDDGQISCYYAPFEYINRQAKIVICGITPGLTQANIALAKAAEMLNGSHSIETAQKSAKNTASFAGTMRNNLVQMMDKVGLQRRLNISSCDALFSEQKHLVHYTSALRYPVFKNDANYNGTPSMIRHNWLRGIVETCLAKEARTLGRDVLWLPLGERVDKALQHLCSRGDLRQEQILPGILHPSGANIERIKVFLGEKDPRSVSKKTNASKIPECSSQLGA